MRLSQIFTLIQLYQKSANTNTSHGTGHHFNFNDQNVTDSPPLKEAQRITGIYRTNSRSISTVTLYPVEFYQIDRYFPSTDRPF